MMKNECPSGRNPRFIQPCILLLLYLKESYGYELIENLKKNGLVETNPDPGVVYRTLRKFEKEGVVESQWLESETGPAKRLYKLTNEGKKTLIVWVKKIQIKVNTLNNFLNIYNEFSTNRGKGENNDNIGNCY